MTTLDWLWVIPVFLAFALLPEVPEWIARLLYIGANRSPRHARRALQRVAVWLALVMLSLAYVAIWVLDLYWTPWTITSGILLLLIAFGVAGGLLWIAFSGKQ